MKGVREPGSTGSVKCCRIIYIWKSSLTIIICFLESALRSWFFIRVMLIKRTVCFIELLLLLLFFLWQDWKWIVYLFIYLLIYLFWGWVGWCGGLEVFSFFFFFFSLCWDLYVLHSSVFPHFWFLMLFYSLPVTLLQVRKYCVNSLSPLTISCFKLTKPEVSDFWF